MLYFQPHLEPIRAVTVSAIPCGFITLPERFFVAPADPEVAENVPSLAFLITHPPLDKDGSPYRILFDMGLRSTLEAYTEKQQQHLVNRRPFLLEPGMLRQLQVQGLQATDIDMVILSHVHYDHTGDPEHFPHSEFRVGHGALHVLKHGLEGAASHQSFDTNLLPRGRTREFPEATRAAGWAPLGPFEAALDLLGDGSVYVIDAPGHLPGHVNLLCHVGGSKWVYLGGDTYHDLRLRTGEKEIGTWIGSDQNVHCIHLDVPKARETIAKVRELASMENVEVIAAHDLTWFRTNGHRLFPQTL